MLPALGAIASTAGKVGAIGKAAGALSNLFSKHPKDKGRIQHEQSMTAKALTGDVNAARDMYGHKSHAATPAAKAAAQAGWDEVSRVRPEVAREAARLGALPHPGNYEDFHGGPNYISPLLDELGAAGRDLRGTLDQAVRESRETAAEAIQRIGSGTVNEIARDVAPSRSSLTIPTTTPMVALVGVLVLFLLFMALRR